ERQRRAQNAPVRLCEEQPHVAHALRAPAHVAGGGREVPVGVFARFGKVVFGDFFCFVLVRIDFLKSLAMPIRNFCNFVARNF
ncbi:MAG: hypothetical protein II394_03385, partial [Bacteroidales bacterium]|nr:hypothetical protein [Bacteroidales bacterium]